MYVGRSAVPYRTLMNDGPGREDWGAFLRRVTSRPGWSVARLSRESGYSKAAIFDWIAAGSGESVKVGSVVAVARTVGEDPISALRAAAGLPATDEEDRDIKAVREAAAGLPESVVSSMIDTVRSWRVRDEERRMADTGELARFVEEQAAS